MGSKRFRLLHIVYLAPVMLKDQKMYTIVERQDLSMNMSISSHYV